MKVARYDYNNLRHMQKSHRRPRVSEETRKAIMNISRCNTALPHTMLYVLASEQLFYADYSKEDFEDCDTFYHYLTRAEPTVDAVGCCVVIGL